jgi:hypothetical protein
LLEGCPFPFPIPTAALPSTERAALFTGLKTSETDWAGWTFEGEGVEVGVAAASATRFEEGEAIEEDEGRAKEDAEVEEGRTEEATELADSVALMALALTIAA